MVIKFKNFLEQEKALDALEECIKNHTDGQENIDSICKRVIERDGDVHFFVSDGFIWTETPQGEDYWLALSKKWAYKVGLPKKHEDVYDQLTSFLESEEVSEAFIDNMTSQMINEKGRSISLRKFLTMVLSYGESPVQIIRGSFNWRKTKEGYGFWEEVEKKWAKHYILTQVYQ